MHEADTFTDLATLHAVNQLHHAQVLAYVLTLALPFKTGVACASPMQPMWREAFPCLLGDSDALACPCSSLRGFLCGLTSAHRAAPCTGNPQQAAQYVWGFSQHPCHPVSKVHRPSCRSISAVSCWRGNSEVVL